MVYNFVSLASFWSGLHFSTNFYLTKIIFTCVNVAVSHCVDTVLAISIFLAKEFVSQHVCLGEGAGVTGVTEIDHLIHSEESLVASLLFFP